MNCSNYSDNLEEAGQSIHAFGSFSALIGFTLSFCFHLGQLETTTYLDATSSWLAFSLPISLTLSFWYVCMWQPQRVPFNDLNDRGRAEQEDGLGYF